MNWLWICLAFVCVQGRNMELGSQMRGTSRFLGQPPQSSASSIDRNIDVAPLSPNSDARSAKFFSLFKVVKFTNDDCLTVTNENGTCYPANECAFRGGVSSGSCANGFGVCCTFSYSCGQTTHQNNSYFSNSNYPSSFDGTQFCQLTVNKMSSNICQLRLDFVTMVLNPPDGNNTNCNLDQFLVTGGSRVPPICGLNTGQHIYVDTSLIGNSPTTLTVVTSGTGFSRQWRIRVTQIGCDSLARADNSCLQYYTGVSGTIRSFNYDGDVGRQLSNQDYSICVRTENNFCGISYTVCPNSPFSITGPTGGSATTTGTPVGALVGASSCNSDWLTIPCASDNGKTIQSGNTVCQDRLCGDAFASIPTPNSGTVISTVRPFRIAVRFDAFEATVPTSVTGVQAQFNNRGFCLNYVQQPCTA